VSRAAMCEVRSRKKQQKTNPTKIKYNDGQRNEMDYDEPHLMSNEKNAAHPVDRTAN